MPRKLGTTTQKILLLLIGGVSLGLTRSPQQQFRIAKKINREWQKINRKKLQDSINNLYKSKMVDMKENKDGAIEMVLTDKGKKTMLLYNFEQMKIPKAIRWDKKWRIITFDIPERLKNARNALREKLLYLGFAKYQKSVFIYPYKCKNEVDFVVEFLNLRPYVRYIEADSCDDDLNFRKYFELL